VVEDAAEPGRALHELPFLQALPEGVLDALRMLEFVSDHVWPGNAQTDRGIQAKVA
jgi:hypothetical protein